MSEVKQKTPAQLRMSAILKRLHDGGSVSVTELAREFDVSDMTVRRDLAELEREGLLERVHGGAVAPSGGPLRLVDDAEPSFEARMQHNRDAKERIAREAARVLAPFRTLAIDVGTTALLAAEALSKGVGAERRRIFTNSLRLAAQVAGTSVDVYVPGGRVRPEELSVMGPGAVDQFSQLNYDAALIGVSGITSEGFYDYSIEDTEMKQVYLDHSVHRVVLCDSSKFRRLSTIRIAGFKAATMLITDAPPPPEIASALAAAGVDLRVAGTE